MNKDVRKTSGTITVFLSLILILILSLILTIIEGARVNTAKVYAERALTSAMDSVLAEYYGPLWEEYHIFGYYNDSQGYDGVEEKIAYDLADTMSYTFNPQVNLMDSTVKDRVNLYDIDISKIDVSNKTTLTDYEGKLLILQAVEYMKYHKIGDGIQTLLSKLSLLKIPDKVTYLMDEKLDLEEELVDIDLNILKLMEILDGLKTSKSGIELNTWGEIKVNPIFAKVICYGDVTMETVGVNHEGLFQVLKPYYLNPAYIFSRIQDGLNDVIRLRSQLQYLREECVWEEKMLREALEELAILGSKENKTSADRLDISNCQKAIQSYRHNIENLQDSISETETKLSKRINEVNEAKKEIVQLISEVRLSTSEAISIMEKLILQVDKAEPLINRYEVLLESEKPNLYQEVYRGLKDEVYEIKRYLLGNDGGYDFHNMKRILEQDLTILIDTENMLNQGLQKMQAYAYDDALSCFHQAKEILSAYQISGLALDYSGLVLNKTEGKNPIKEISNLIQSNMLDLIISPEKISQLELEKTISLPSVEAALQRDEKDFLASIGTLLKKGLGGVGDLNLGSLFGNLDEGGKLSNFLLEGLNKAAELILFQEYIKEHFGGFQTVENSSEFHKPSVLAYEKEYILIGKEKDMDNLSSIVTQILAIRTIFDFVSILGDSAKREEAKLVAAALVGITGLPFLVGITQALIMIAWSFAEALLDTCALMIGKSVPILKNGIMLELSEVFLINREYLNQRAKSMTASQQLSITYEGYLQVFFFLKDLENLAYRSMDLIQENIRLRYQINNFALKNSIYGYEVHSEYRVKSKFIGISFVQQYLNHQTNSFHFSIQGAYSY